VTVFQWASDEKINGYCKQMGYETWKSLEDPSLINGFLASVVMNPCIQDVPGGNVNILGGHSIAHTTQKLDMCMCPIPNGFRDRAI
jgi:hypothetical protein